MNSESTPRTAIWGTRWVLICLTSVGRRCFDSKVPAFQCGVPAPAAALRRLPREVHAAPLLLQPPVTWSETGEGMGLGARGGLCGWDMLGYVGMLLMPAFQSDAAFVAQLIRCGNAETQENASCVDSTMTTILTLASNRPCSLWTGTLLFVFGWIRRQNAEDSGLLRILAGKSTTPQSHVGKIRQTPRSFPYLPSAICVLRGVHLQKASNTFSPKCGAGFSDGGRHPTFFPAGAKALGFSPMDRSLNRAEGSLGFSPESDRGCRCPTTGSARAGPAAPTTWRARARSCWPRTWTARCSTPTTPGQWHSAHEISRFFFFGRGCQKYSG